MTELTRLDLRENSYILAEKVSRNKWCYTRFVKSVPSDQICEQAQELRYSPEPDISRQKLAPIPTYVLALFTFMSDPKNAAGCTDLTGCDVDVP